MESEPPPLNGDIKREVNELFSITSTKMLKMSKIEEGIKEVPNHDICNNSKLMFSVIKSK